MQGECSLAQRPLEHHISALESTQYPSTSSHITLTQVCGPIPECSPIIVHTHMQDKHVVFVVVSKPIVVHVMPQELEGLGLFSTLKKKEGEGRWRGEVAVIEGRRCEQPPGE